MYTKNPFEMESVPSDDPEDRRTSKRRHLIYYLRVWDRDSGEVLGHVVDITTEGLMLISERPIATDREYALEIRWQDADEGDCSVRFKALSRWCSEDVNPDFHDTGFRLLVESADALEPIHELIREFGFDD